MLFNANILEMLWAETNRTELTNEQNVPWEQKNNQRKKEREGKNSLISRALFVIIVRSFANQPTCAKAELSSVANWHSNSLSAAITVVDRN